MIWLFSDTIFIVSIPELNNSQNLNPPLFNSQAAKAENIEKQSAANPNQTAENPVKKFNLP
ncbi:MAG: hypothetical protein GY797_18600 [Deltaproteobacteria bacterium]|nr:hypothetical protein [Deltaproteobacteria bacterium]